MKKNKVNSEQYCKEHFADQPEIHDAVKQAYEAGWAAATDFICNLKLDEVFDYLEKHITEKEK